MFEIYRGSISREDLINIFLIDFNEIRNELVRINFKNIEEFKYKIHIICMKYLKEYSLKSNEYFKSINDIEKCNFIDVKLQEYAFKNYWFMRDIGIDYYDFDDIISIQNAYINYYRDENQLINKEETNNIKNFRRKFREFINEEFNPIHNNLVLYRKQIKKIDKGYEIDKNYKVYKVLEKIFIHAINERNKSPYKITNKEEIKRYNKNIDFVEKFMEIPNLTIQDIYYFERIYNINFIFKFYEMLNKLRKFEEISIEDMFNILRGVYGFIYLPNIFENIKLIEIIVTIYGNYYINNFILLQSEVDKMSNDLLSCFLPLYNSLYRSILDEYDLINNIQEINNLEKKEEDKLESIKKYDTIYNNILEKKENEEKYKIKQKKEYAYLSDVIASNFDFYKLNECNLNENIYGDNFINKIEEMKKEYKIKLKQFILMNKLKIE